MRKVTNADLIRRYLMTVPNATGVELMKALNIDHVDGNLVKRGWLAKIGERPNPRGGFPTAIYQITKAGIDHQALRETQINGEWKPKEPEKMTVYDMVMRGWCEKKEQLSRMKWV